MLDWNLLTLTCVFIAALGVYAFRDRILGALRRFNDNNTARRAEEMRALFDKYAHYRQTVRFADEQFEMVSEIAIPDPRSGQAVKRFIFLGIQYATRDEAEAARHDAIIAKAREFYIDLDRTYLGRGRADEPPRPAGPLLERNRKSGNRFSDKLRD